MSNSIKQVVEYLKKNSHKTETEILKAVWGYERCAHNTGFRHDKFGTCWESNKKYADLIRRGIRSGKIYRISAIRNNRRTWLYKAGNV